MKITNTNYSCFWLVSAKVLSIRFSLRHHITYITLIEAVNQLFQLFVNRQRVNMACGVCQATQDLHQIDDEAIEILSLRLERRIESQHLCEKDYKKWFQCYCVNQRYCCDPLKLHPGSKIKKQLKTIDMDYRKRCSVISNLVPGKKCCKRCQVELSEKLEEELQKSSQGSSLSQSTQSSLFTSSR